MPPSTRPTDDTYLIEAGNALRSAAQQSDLTIGSVERRAATLRWRSRRRRRAVGALAALAVTAVASVPVTRGLRDQPSSVATAPRIEVLPFHDFIERIEQVPTTSDTYDYTVVERVEDTDYLPGAGAPEQATHRTVIEEWIDANGDATHIIVTDELRSANGTVNLIEPGTAQPRAPIFYAEIDRLTRSRVDAVLRSPDPTRAIAEWLVPDRPDVVSEQQAVEVLLRLLRYSSMNHDAVVAALLYLDTTYSPAIRAIDVAHVPWQAYTLDVAGEPIVVAFDHYGRVRRIETTQLTETVELTDSRDAVP